VGVFTVSAAPAVFLDRDGVINRAVVRDGKPYPPAHVDDLEVLPGVPEALARLKSAGFALIVVTNQPDVARGRQTEEAVQAIHDRLTALLPIDEFRVCWHDDADRCECRKPRPGLLTRAPRYDLARSYIVGDRWRDVEAGRAAGCRAAILIGYGYDEGLSVEPDIRLHSLSEAADWILSGRGTPQAQDAVKP
jgi:D-glycero-D-manno-heptose 1,7-bisphosphate phosphatase